MNLSEAEALHKAAAFCSTSERCLSEVREKLRNWGIEADGQERILKRLIDERFVDESRFAAAFVKDKFRFNQWGRIKIRIMLQQKKVGTHLIEDAMELINEEEYHDCLVSILKQKRKTLKDKDTMQLKAKLYRFAASRGFESDVIFKVVPKLLGNVADDME